MTLLAVESFSAGDYELCLGYLQEACPQWGPSVAAQDFSDEVRLVCTFCMCACAVFFSLFQRLILFSTFFSFVYIVVCSFSQITYLFLLWLMHRTRRNVTRTRYCWWRTS